MMNAEILEQQYLPMRENSQKKPLIAGLRTRRTGNIFCRFSSVQSFTKFQQRLASPPRIQKKNQDAIPTQSTLPPIVDKNINEPLVIIKQLNCAQCLKELLVEGEEGVCGECQQIGKFVNSGNFQRFVSYLMDFKAFRVQSYHQHKLKRIESIESIQSFTMDKIYDSQRSNFRFVNMQRQQNPPNSLKNTKNSHLADSTTYAGYFCNNCQVVPIQGRRFHCLSCQDYDLCERCYFYVGHKHQMKTFKEIPEEIANRARMGAIKKTESMENSLNFLSSSIRDFQKASKLCRTTALKRY